MSPALGQTPGRVEQASGTHHDRRFVLTHAALESTSPAASRQIPARAHACPGAPATAQLVILDSSMIPTAAHFDQWGAQLAALGFTAMRSGALAPRHALQAEQAGLLCIQELALLEATPPWRIPRPHHRTSRSSSRRATDLAAVDQVAFGEVWRLDASMLADVRTATPASRARVVTAAAIARRSGRTIAPALSTDVAGFLLAGRAGRNGYIQRLAVDVRARREGVATSLLVDAMRWLRRRRVDRIFVNTHVENEPALQLYRTLGFSVLPERLRVFEGPTRR